MPKKHLIGLTTLVCLLSLSFFVGCGDTEDMESSDSIVIPRELYDPSDLTYDISDEEVQELMNLDIPTNWEQTKDPELRAKYYHANLLKQFGDIPAVHIVAAHKRKRALGPHTVTPDEMVDHAKARYVLWPNASNKDNLETALKTKLMQETDDPELYAKIYREQLIKQFGDIPEVHTVVESEKKMKFGGIIFPGGEDELIAYYEALYVLWPDESTLRHLEKARKAKADGTPFHLVDWDDDQ